MTCSEPPRPTAAHRGRDALGRGGVSTAAHRVPPDGVRGAGSGHGPQSPTVGNTDNAETSGRGHTPNASTEEPTGQPAAATPEHALTDSVATLSGQHHAEHLAHLDTPELDTALAAVVATIHQRQPRWMAHAACRHHPHLDWHMRTHRPVNRTRQAEIEAMRTVCATCPVLDQCTDWAVRTDTTAQRLPGVVAGLTVGQRRQLRPTTTTLTPLED